MPSGCPYRAGVLAAILVLHSGSMAETLLRLVLGAPWLVLGSPRLVIGALSRLLLFLVGGVGSPLVPVWRGIRVRRWFLSGGAFGFAVGACVEGHSGSPLVPEWRVWRCAEGLAVCGGVIAPSLVVIASTQARADRHPLPSGEGRPLSPPLRQRQTVNPSTKARALQAPGSATGALISRTCGPSELAAHSSSRPT